MSAVRRTVTLSPAIGEQLELTKSTALTITAAANGALVLRGGRHEGYTCTEQASTAVFTDPDALARFFAAWFRANVKQERW